MRKITTYLYEFEELSDRAKERAIEEFRVHNLEDWGWHEHIKDDAKAIGALMGIEIENIYFSGFGSQGDGACFTGTYAYQEDSVEKVKEYAPEDRLLHEIAQELYDVQKKNWFQVTAEITHNNNRYYHSHSVEITALPSTSLQHVAHPLRRFMDWIYDQLKKEYENIQSDESIIETIKANDYEFNEDGVLT